MNWDFFSKVVVINLDSRPDRLKATKIELERAGIKDWYRLPGVEKSPGWKGFNASMKLALEEIAGCEVGLILEDDVMFEKGLDSLESALLQLPKDWQALWLGANVKAQCPRISPNLNRLTAGWTTHAVAYKGKFAEFLLNSFNWGGNEVYDDWLKRNIQPEFNCYITRPFVAIQRPDVSDIQGRHCDYRNLFDYSQQAFL